MTNGFGRLKNIANIGDIVIVAGYFEEFRVESWTHELEYQPDYSEETILYDLADVVTGEYLLAYQEDISVIRRGEEGENAAVNPELTIADFVKGVDISEYTDKLLKGMGFEREEEEPMGKYERIDRLLTEISDYRDLIRNFGDKEGEYEARISEAKLELKELTGGNGK